MQRKEGRTMAKKNGNGFNGSARFSVIISEDGDVTVSVEQGEYRKVGYRSASATMRRCVTLDGETLAPIYGDDTNLARVLVALGPDCGKVVRNAIDALQKGQHMAPSDWEEKQEARWEEERAEAERAEAGKACEPEAPADSDETV
jgi:hypothetical protein